ncbi:DNA photolyase family protein [Corynebacterium sp. ES2794-CONJ1]|uniref:cryptochrome/photolyase family protein n=1 Tax=unclassified Corynebacterium TaxID=2624378 RepID=UPI00216929FC|nr:MULTISPECIES: deoxyribodipyrimidine photo-lyase [unclassified Corynebacterium]MCS4489220.1 DNA photolyase family protein [Corynebacterium sp. ES2775-CONJ]MCS4491033.1 DNA photolyase family protein [Corynebacterium sp. ES2715-CONJ3]MCS4531086.1 DNA photolyase family protein [Corynebacterium sp. ES2730-CONJ]MCU9518453.1 DNA photolyase family protein [Corynebacterium sp. ES2794-CONJ1]
MTEKISLMWFRDDLRLEDNKALESLAGHSRIHALYILDTSSSTRPLGRASQWWLHHSLVSLATQLADYNIRLQIALGDPRKLIPQLAHDLGAQSVAWSRRYYQPWCEMDAHIKSMVHESGIEAHSYPGHLLLEPWQVRTLQGEAYRVYTPFSKRSFEVLHAQSSVDLADVLSDNSFIEQLDGAGADLEASMVEIAQLRLLPADRGEPNWAKEFPFKPGEQGAWEVVEKFGTPTNYHKGRDFPAVKATSGLAPHLRFGEISIRRLFELVGDSADAHVFRKELLWRDFAWHRLYENPQMIDTPLREKFAVFPWWKESYRIDDIHQRKIAPDNKMAEFTAWARGETGIPLVDAGMRELMRTGTMHNRVRMVVGSLLTKNLGTHWIMGEEWFWDSLVDADLASNTFNWQWVAGCGDDAAPYFRIFNPITQQQRFDADYHYCSSWVPELHTPIYPEPVVDVKASRTAALHAYDEIKE